MTYFINAWLERPQPYLQVIHRESGRICVDFPAPILEAPETSIPATVPLPRKW